MHELSIALNIIDIVTSEAMAAGAAAISCIELEIGQWSGIEPHAIEFAMSEAIVGTMASQANIAYHWVAPTAKCIDCGSTFEPEDVYKICPYCHSSNTTLLTGKELKIKSIEALIN